MAFLGGHSGAGKSTFAEVDFAPLSAQLMAAFGLTTTRYHSYNSQRHSLLRRNIGIVFQDHRLLMDRSIFDNVALPMRIESISENEIKRRVSAAREKPA
ncbi:ATP-binding cassette domain-containing protein [Vibrio lentus]|nr:ATP-binding cassette domain-containing protein [Vibrio lentus]